MPILNSEPENKYDRMDRIEQERETIYIEGPREECKVGGIPVSVYNAWINIFAACDPCTPYLKYIRDKGGFYQKDKRVKK